MISLQFYLGMSVDMPFMTDFATSGNCQKSKIFFVTWSSPSSRIRAKMLDLNLKNVSCISDLNLKDKVL